MMSSEAGYSLAIFKSDFPGDLSAAIEKYENSRNLAKMHGIIENSFTKIPVYYMGHPAHGASDAAVIC